MSRFVRSGTAVLAMTALMTPAAASVADAAPDRPTAPVVWTAFQQTSPADHPADLVQFAIEAPIVRKPMVGQTITLDATTPTGIDCTSLSGGIGEVASSDVALTVTSCTGSEIQAQTSVTSDMIGERPSLVGWVSTANLNVPIKATVSQRGKTSDASATATRTTPLGTPTSLGSWNGQDVSVASRSGLNEVWVGSTQYPAPTGTAVHSVLANGTVYMWFQTSNSMDAWILDLATGSTSTASVPFAHLLAQGASGFVIERPAPAGGYQSGDDTMYFDYYSWTDHLADTFGKRVVGYPGYGFPGFTADALVVTVFGRGGTSSIELISNQGQGYGSDGVTTAGWGGYLTITGIDSAGVSYDKREASYTTVLNPAYHCRITAAGKTCTVA